MIELYNFQTGFLMDNLLEPEIRDSVYNGVLPMALDSEMPLQLICVDDIGALVALAFKDPDKLWRSAGDCW